MASLSESFSQLLWRILMLWKEGNVSRRHCLHQISSTMKYSPPSNIVHYQKYLWEVIKISKIQLLNKIIKLSESNLEIVTLLAIMQFLWLLCLFARSVCLYCIYNMKLRLYIRFCIHAFLHYRMIIVRFIIIQNVI